MKVLLDVFVKGQPKPQGSMKAIPHKQTGRPVLVYPAGVKPWRRLVEASVREAGVLYVAEGPVALELEFWLPRPISAPKRAPRRTRLAAKRPDIDKLARAVLDALTGVLFRDDSQVTDLVTRKRVCYGPGERPGVRVRAEVPEDAEREIVGEVDLSNQRALFGDTGLEVWEDGVLISGGGQP
jgi:crossover junction endodeoxyribonuclease RusA